MPILNDISLAQIEFETNMKQSLQFEQQIPESLFQFIPSTTVSTTFTIGGTLGARLHIPGSEITGQPMKQETKTITKKIYEVTYTLDMASKVSTDTDIEGFVMKQMPYALGRASDYVAFEMIKNTVTPNIYLTNTANGIITLTGGSATGARIMSIDDVLAMQAIMDNGKVPVQDRYMIINAEALQRMLSASPTLASSLYNKAQTPYINGAQVFDTLASFKVLVLKPFDALIAGTYDIDNVAQYQTSSGNTFDSATSKYTTYFFSAKPGFETFRLEYNPGMDKFYKISDTPNYMGWQYFSSIYRGGVAALPNSLYKLISAA